MARGKGRGGSRQGTPGTVYTNRTDLNTNRAPAQPIRAAPNQTYGVRGAQEAAQRAIPLPAPPPLMSPTARPSEPLTAGLAVGAGPGPEAITQPTGLTPDQTLSAQLRGLYAAYPNSDLARLIQSLSD